MANTIQIKRSTSTAAPGSLTAGELAYSQDSDKLWIGRPSDNAVIAIGGQLYVNMLDHFSHCTTERSTNDYEVILATSKLISAFAKQVRMPEISWQ